MNIAVLWPSCGNKHLDILCVAWIFLIGLEILDRTCRLYLTNANVPLFSKFVEVFVITFFGASYMTSRLFRAGPFKDPYAGKVLVCVALLYFYYRQTLIYLPISPQVGPLLYSIKLMVLRDFTSFMRMGLLVVICGGIVTHAILYPDYPLTIELFRRIFHKAWFAFFLTPITDLPDIEQRMKEKLERTRQSANRRRGAWRDFEEGEDVLVQGLRPGDGEWLSGKVNKRVPSANYELPACTQDVVSRRSLGSPVHIDGARETSDAEQVDEQADDTNKEPVTLQGPSSAGGDCGGAEPQPSQPELRRSTRQRRPPDRY
ncbi:hypothetical protein MTO96_047400 [Rhipicephalus appendiculatus]